MSLKATKLLIVSTLIGFATYASPVTTASPVATPEQPSSPTNNANVKQLLAQCVVDAIVESKPSEASIFKMIGEAVTFLSLGAVTFYGSAAALFYAHEQAYRNGVFVTSLIISLAIGAFFTLASGAHFLTKYLFEQKIASLALSKFLRNWDYVKDSASTQLTFKVNPLVKSFAVTGKLTMSEKEASNILESISMSCRA